VIGSTIQYHFFQNNALIMGFHMISKFSVWLMSLMALLSIGSNVQAAISLGNIVGGVINELEDDDFDMLVNAGGTLSSPGTDFIIPLTGDNTIDVGDYLAAIVRITGVRVPVGGAQVATATDSEATITAVVFQRIATRLVLAGGAADGINDVIYGFATPTAAEWAAVGMPLALIPSNDSTFIIAFEDADNIDQTTGSAATAFATVDGIKLWELGFTGAAGEFWTASSDTFDIGTSFGVVTGSFTAAINVTGQFAGPVLVPFVRPGGAVIADVHLVNGSIGAASPGAFPPFPVSSDVDILIQPVVPEPASLLIWGGLLAGAGMWGRTRRVKVK
jgi:hypothetical protein